MVNALNNRALAFFVKGKIDNSIAELKQTLEIIKQMDDPIRLGRYYSNIGSLYREQSKFQKALRNYNSSLKIFNEHNKEDEQADVINNIGLIYFDIQNYDLALQHLSEALVIYKKLGLDDDIGNIWLNIGFVYFYKEDYKKAIDYGKKALKILKSTKNQFSEADCYLLFAKANQKLNNSNEALDNAKRSLEINKAFENKGRIIENQILIAELIFNDNTNKATELAEETLMLISDDIDNELRASLYRLLYKCYKEKNKYNLSLDMHEKYMIYKDSVQIKRNMISIARETIKNEYEAILYQNKIDNENAQAQLKIKQLKRLYTTIFITILIVLSSLLYVRHTIIINRKKRALLLDELETLKSKYNSTETNYNYTLNRQKIEESIGRQLNETDWNVLNILLDDPVISNKELAEKAFLSVDGIGSSLRRMYDYFNIKNSRYKKISLITEAIKFSNKIA